MKRRLTENSSAFDASHSTKAEVGGKRKRKRKRKRKEADV
jgi:hypothetical protein